MEDGNFFLIFVQDMSAPRYKHSDFNTAETEAKRLAKLTGKKTFVLKPITSYLHTEFVTQIF